MAFGYSDRGLEDLLEVTGPKHEEFWRELLMETVVAVRLSKTEWHRELLTDLYLLGRAGEPIPGFAAENSAQFLNFENIAPNTIQKYSGKDSECYVKGIYNNLIAPFAKLAADRARLKGDLDALVDAFDAHRAEMHSANARARAQDTHGLWPMRKA